MNSKLTVKLLNFLGIDPSVPHVIRRTYAGHNQLSAGAWSCILETVEDPCYTVIGWNGSLRELLNSKYVAVYVNRQTGDATLLEDFPGEDA